MGKDTITLASGREMPLVGFGLWKVPRETCADTVYNAIKTGYRLFDGAYDYQNEKETGEGVRRAIADGLVKREDIFITTKLWNNYHRKEHALEMAKKQNETLGLGYIDLYLIHFPVALKYIEPSKIPYPAWWQDEAQTIVETDNVPIRETWEVLESLVDQGIAKSIGVSNFQAQSLYDPDLISMAQENNIAVTAYSSFGPQSFLEISNKRAIGAKGLFEVDAVTKAAAAHNATPAQVLLRWATQRGIAVIPKSNSQNRLQQNLEVNGFDLTPAEIEAISDLDLGLRFNDPGFYLPQKPLRIFA
ncbi:aldo/keto reductase [Colletotrichum gloeosporioides Cg-14]|uniref:Aldo/keto reductase n=1 Tax=Colletotrichum gloeosporioides (strain Cg-14) TaxID=1237896 RepID=T0M8Q2_COLGC|nr:aldo/keto reductase [Colletotrichum gloeosporioides Cg-14]